MSIRPVVRGDSAKILIVDDDAPLAAGLKLALQSQGYLVRVVNRGSQALDAAVAFRPDLVLLDVMMPNMDGWEVLSILRANESTEGVAVIMLTASDSDAAKLKGFDLGADDYITKSFNLQELRCRIAAVLRRTMAPRAEADTCSIPVVSSGSEFELIRSADVYFAEGIRNYTYVHTCDARYLSRLALHALEDKQVPGLVRVHRSFIVNMEHVRGCGWVSKSSYHLRLGDLAGTEVPVSRALIPEVQRRLGVRS